jgi:membrane associated rhomboid family serine protease
VIPLRDTIPSRSFPGVTIALIVANCAAFLYQLSLGADNAALVAALGAVPAQFTHRAAYPAAGLPASVTLLTSMFLHGGLLHLGGNMLFLWIFGDNVEDATGHLRFLAFYVLCGVVAAYAHILTHPASTMPMVGASGAISGVLGAYFLLYPYARVVTLVFLGFFAQTVAIPAFFFLGFWFVMQFLSSTAGAGSAGGVAWFAHVGGFVAGLVLLLLFKRRGVRLWSPVSR